VQASKYAVAAKQGGQMPASKYAAAAKQGGQCRHQNMPLLLSNVASAGIEIRRCC
jgi:hypothetical protein